MLSIKTLSLRPPSSSHRKRAFALLVALAAFSQVISAAPLTLSAQIERSEVIVVGAIISVRQVDMTEVAIAGRSVPAKLYEAEVHVDRALKGHAPPSPLFVRFPIEDNPAGGSGRYRGVAAPSYRIMFLRPLGSHFAFTDPQFPSLPAEPGPPLTSPDVVSAVVQELARVISSPNAEEMNKLEVMYRLESVPLPAVTDIFQRQLSAIDPVLRATAVSALLQRNSLQALAVARELVMNPPPNVPDYLIGNIASAIGRGVKDEKAIPILADLIRAPDARTRRSVAYALRNTASRQAIPALVAALNDSDREVRYYAVIGLGEITNQPDWRPLMEDFLANEKKYLQYWRAWATENRQPEHPST